MLIARAAREPARRPKLADGPGRASRVLCVVLVLVLAAVQDRAAAAEKFRPFKMKTLEGAQKSLSEMLGRTTLVVFFFPTCKFCNAAFPDIQKLHDSYKDRGLSIVWINAVPEEEALIAAWRSKHGYTVPILLGGHSVQGDYKLAMTPTHYLLDSQGRVLWKHAGYRPGDEKILEREIQQALAGIP
jgi:thiol-disulfide isomerase/thioredoxin